MTMTFHLLSTDFDGLTLELWHDPPSVPNLPFGINVFQIGSAPIVSGDADVNVTPVNDFAVRVRDTNGTTLLRSGLRDLSVGTIDSNGDFSTIALPIATTQVLTPAEVAAIAPATPLTEDDLTVTAISLGIVGDLLRAAGSANYDTNSFLGSVPVTFTYDFRLRPFTSLTNTDRLLDVETVSTVVRGAQGGLFGWLVNIIVLVVQAIMKDTIVAQIESTVQQQLDDSIADQLASQGVTDDVTVTVRSVGINGTTGITIEAFALVMTNNLCPGTISSGSVRRRSADQVRRMRLMRDRTLQKHVQGRAYVHAFETHQRELLQILLKHRDILRDVDALVARGMQEINGRTPGKSVLSAETAEQATALLQKVAKVASPELRVVINGVLPDVKSFTGRSVDEVFADTDKRLRLER